MIPSTKTAIGLCCDPLPERNGYTWTLVSLLGDFLATAEQLYGPRDRDWTLLGIEFCGDGPQIWYPGNRKHVSIMLSESARTDVRLAIWEIAHEVIHILSPSGDRSALLIEEGLATFFAHYISDRHRLGKAGGPVYASASQIVRWLLETYPDGILRMRAYQPMFLKFTPDLVRSVIPAISLDFARALCLPFSEIADNPMKALSLMQSLQGKLH
jgi:hypothetical protein